MKTQVLADAASNVTVAAQTAVDLGNKTPFLPGRKYQAEIRVSPDATAAATIKVQGSDDNSTWVDLLTSTTLAGKEGMVTGYRYMRATVTVGGTAGTYTAAIRSAP